MSSVPILNLPLLQQLAVLTAGLREGLPAEPLLQTLQDHSKHMPAEEAFLLHQMGEDLRVLREGKAAGSGDLTTLLKELTRAIDHQVRNAHNVATTNLQTGEMELEGIAAVLSALGDTQGLLALEQARAQLRIAREGLLRASAFLDALESLSASLSKPGEDSETLHRRIADLMNWKPEILSAPQQAARPESPSRPRVSLLYVEDDLDAGEMVSLFLGRLDFVEAVHQSSSYSGALQVFSKNPSVSILVTDYHLFERETGLELARELRRRKPSLKTLFTSGSVHEMKELLTEEEEHDFILIPKPIDLMDLEARLRDAAANNISQ